jgi:nucleoside 2-deoxyribosyltransferase
MKIYLIGSLRNPKVLELGNLLRENDFNVFDDWMAAGPRADDSWRDYEKQRGHSYAEALNGIAAKHVFDFDKTHLESSDVAVLLMPAGKSAHIELGYMIGRGKLAFVLFDKEPERYDVMYKFATGVFFSASDLINALKLVREHK